MNDTNQRLPADEIEALLPWYAAGTLDASEARQVEAALAADAKLAQRLDLVREEMTETIVLNEALGVPSARVAEKLFSAIDRERAAARAPAASGLIGRLADWLSPRVFAYAAGAAVLLIAVEAGVIAKLALQDQAHTGGSYVPQSVPPTRSIEIGAFAKVQFAPQASMAEVTHFLNERAALIVDGPSNGLYRVRIGRDYVQKDELDRMVKDFRSASPIVVAATAD